VPTGWSIDNVVSPIRLFFICLLLVVTGCATAPPPQELDAAGRPITWLRNDRLAAMIYLPDAEHGHYRGPRFDWSGMIGQVVVNDQRFFGPYLPGKDDPVSNDCNAVGPADEFGMTSPLGYDEAKPGETFIKIGVGHLTKSGDGGEYNFYGNYSIARPAAWSVRALPDGIAFSQQLSDPRGWGYRYEKTLTLTPGAPELIITHRLTNTGTRAIDTDQYCHNFTRFGDELVGPGCYIELPFDAATSNTQHAKAAAEFASRRFTMLRTLKPLEGVKGEFISITAQPLPYSATISNGRQAILIDCARTPSALKYFGCTASLCVEPFIPIRLAPGEETAWSVRYRFVTHLDGGPTLAKRDVN
jgi:hypothetical protein